VGIRRLIPLLTVVLLATSCSLDVPTEVGNIAIYLEVDKATLPLDESVTITATARNVGYDTITLTGPSDCLVYIQILNSTGLIVYNADQLCTGATVTENLEAGMDKVRAFVWSGTNQAGARVPAGLYTIRAIARVTGDPYLGTAPLTIALE